MIMKTAPRKSMRAVTSGACAGTNCGRKARKNSESFGLKILVRMPFRTMRGARSAG